MLWSLCTTAQLGFYIVRGRGVRESALVGRLVDHFCSWFDYGNICGLSVGCSGTGCVLVGVVGSVSAHSWEPVSRLAGHGRSQTGAVYALQQLPGGSGQKAH